MPSSPSPGFPSFGSCLSPNTASCVRVAFVREAALAEGRAGAGGEPGRKTTRWRHGRRCAHRTRAANAPRIELLCSRRDVRARILLQGYSRFSHVVASLAGRIRRDAGVSCHRTRHRRMGGQRPPQPECRRRALPCRRRCPTTEDAGGRRLLRLAAARDYVIDLPQKTDAAAIARCFLEVYGHHYVHAEVFSTRRYWDKVERGGLIPAVARTARAR